MFEHVRGHVGIEGNEMADQLACQGSMKPRKDEIDWQSLRLNVEKEMNGEFTEEKKHMAIDFEVIVTEMKF